MRERGNSNIMRSHGYENEDNKQEEKYNNNENKQQPLSQLIDISVVEMCKYGQNGRW